MIMMMMMMMVMMTMMMMIRLNRIRNAKAAKKIQQRPRFQLISNYSTTFRVYLHISSIHSFNPSLPFSPSSSSLQINSIPS